MGCPDQATDTAAVVGRAIREGRTPSGDRLGLGRKGKRAEFLARLLTGLRNPFQSHLTAS